MKCTVNRAQQCSGVDRPSGPVLINLEAYKVMRPIFLDQGWWTQDFQINNRYYSISTSFEAKFILYASTESQYRYVYPVRKAPQRDNLKQYTVNRYSMRTLGHSACNSIFADLFAAIL